MVERMITPLLTLLLGCAEEAPVYGVSFGGERLPVVDMHLHQGEWNLIPESTRRFLASRFPAPLGLIAESTAEGSLNAEGVLEQLDQAGVIQGALFAVYAPRTVGVATNEYVAEQVLVDPERLFGLGSLRLDDWNNNAEAQLADLAATLEKPGFIGIKLAHAHQHVRLDDPRFDALWSLAAATGKPVYLHTGSSPFPNTAQDAAYTDPAYFEPIIAAYPDAQFILGHLGYDFINKEIGALDTCVELAARYENVWLEPSALGSAGSDPTGANLLTAYSAMKGAGVLDRVVYGSDGPQSPGFVAEYLERSLAAMEGAGYTAEEARAVLSLNFAAVFGVEPAPL